MPAALPTDGAVTRLRRCFAGSKTAALLGNPGFRRLYAGRMVSRIGDKPYFVAAMWLVFELTGSTFFTGLAGFLARLPQATGFLFGPLVDLDSVPEVRDDLFAASNCDAYDHSRVCYLQLRGYEHEHEAARFLASHDVRCPYVNAPPASPDPQNNWLITKYEGNYYRITCGGHGD